MVGGEGFGAILGRKADCRSKLPTPPNETSVPVFQLRPFVAETSFETSVNNDSWIWETPPPARLMGN